MNYYLAVDIGASSGRHILFHLEEGKICAEEVHRFANGAVVRDGHLVWDLDHLFAEILIGMKKCRELGKIPVSMGIDTWGVDFCLLDADDHLLGNCYCYRDSRTEGMEEALEKRLSASDLYYRTGIQKASFNTIYQLLAVKKNHPDWLEKAQSFLMVPDYFHFLLTGVKKQEYTNATTTQLVSPVSGSWDDDLLDELGLSKRLFGPLSMPGTLVGGLRSEIEAQVGFNLKVVLPATHDTGSAVMSLPIRNSNEDVLYISSGTWSLMGCELSAANCSEGARLLNFTNEGGYDHRYRFLKNIMGLWMIQSVQKEFLSGRSYSGQTGDEDYSFASLCAHAAEETIDSIIDVNDDRFLAPESMTDQVLAACRESGQELPVTPWQIARVIYRSLAVSYSHTVGEIEAVTGKSFHAIHIIGGGAKAGWLDELTAEMTGRRVYAGPYEATAIGNAGAQMIADGEFSGLTNFRACLAESFELKEY